MVISVSGAHLSWCDVCLCVHMSVRVCAYVLAYVYILYPGRFVYMHVMTKTTI